MIRSATGFERARGALALAAALAAMSGEARAQAPADPQARAMAEALFKEGKKLFNEGKIPDACRKLESSYRIDPAGGVLLNLAICHEKEGKTATAWAELNEALALAKKASRADRQKIASEHINALEPKLSRLTVAVSPEAAAIASIEVKVDNVVLAQGAWGTAIPVDPGDHMATATAPGKKPFEAAVSLKLGESKAVVIPLLADVPKEAPPPAEAGIDWKRPTGITSVCVSGGLLVTGTFFGVRALVLAAESEKGCKNGLCTPEAFDAFNRGKSAALAADVLLGVGFALAAAGTVLTILSFTSKRQDNAPPQGTSFWLRPVGPGAAVGGVF